MYKDLRVSITHFKICAVLFTFTSIHSTISWHQEALFCPYDPVKERLLHLLQEERLSLQVAVYQLTDRDVADALIDAYARGVTVSLVVDAQSTEGRYNQALRIIDAGVPVSVYPSLNGPDRRPLMHNKFIIFGRNEGGKSLVWTGSVNFSKAGFTANHENIFITEDPAIVARYKRYFAKLSTEVSCIGASRFAAKEKSVRHRSK